MSEAVVGGIGSSAVGWAVATISTAESGGGAMTDVPQRVKVTSAQWAGWDTDPVTGTV